MDASEKTLDNIRSTFLENIDQYRQRVLKLANYMLGSFEGEDVAQEALIKAWNNLPKFRGDANLNTWIYRIAVNECLMKLRRRHINISSLDEPITSADGEESKREIADDKPNPYINTLNKEQRAVLVKAVEELPPAQRVVFVLRDIENLSTEETSRALEIGQGAVKSNLAHAREKLRNSTELRRAMGLKPVHMEDKKPNPVRHKASRQILEFHFLAAQITGRNPDQYNLVLTPERAIAYSKAIAGLPDKYRKVYDSRIIQERSEKETCHMLGLPKGTVGSQLAYARDLLCQSKEFRAAVIAGEDIATSPSSFSPARSRKIVPTITAMRAVLPAGPLVVSTP